MRKIFGGIVFVAVLSLFMATAMAGNGPGGPASAEGQDMSISEERCSACHRAIEVAYIEPHHSDEVLEQQGCMDYCHTSIEPLFKLIPDCGLCHTGGQRDHHPLPDNNCDDCHVDSAPIPAPESVLDDDPVVHSDESDCSGCHSFGNQGQQSKNQNEAEGNQHQRGR